jgi:chloramphenicol 3-O phosphotransferase
VTARVVLLNGPGSAGKTSIARALQAITATPFLTVAMDGFLEMLPPGLWDHPDGWRLVRHEEDGQPSIELAEGPAGRRLMLGMRRAVAALALAGNDLILDEILLDDAAADYRALLAGCRVHWVKVDAPLAVIEQRERRRGDRDLGLARWQQPRVHRDVAYDLEIDSDRLSPEAAALAIKQRFGL